MLPVWAAVSCTTVAVRKDEPVSSWVARDSIQRKAQAAREVTSQRLAGLPLVITLAGGYARHVEHTIAIHLATVEEAYAALAV